MDEGELRRKRLRIFAPSHPDSHQYRSTEQNPHNGVGSSSHAAITPYSSYGQPIPTSEPEPADMPFSPGAQLRAIKQSVSTRITSATASGKRKKIEVVDLTDDSDISNDTANPLTEDERLARQLQAEYDNEGAASGGFPNDDSGLSASMNSAEHLDEDARIARELEAELNADNLASTSHLSNHNPYWDYSKTSAQDLTDQDDEAYARQLQAEFDGEHTAAPVAQSSQPSGASGRAEQHHSTSALDPHASRRLLQSFAEAARHMACAGCGKPCLSSESEVVLKFKQWFESSDVPLTEMSSVSVCSKARCTAGTCLGCGKQSTNPRYSITLDKKFRLSWCCARGRVILIWIVLCGFDRRRTVKQRRDSYFTSPKKSVNLASGAGVGYGGGGYSSYAMPQALKPIYAGKYGTYAPRGANAGPSGNNSPAPSEAAEDEITARVMACMNVLLPSLLADDVSDFDLDPPNALGAVLTQSNILSKIAELLRNDSLEDATKRMPLYNQTLEVVNKLGSHHATASTTIHQARHVQDGGPDLLNLSFASSTESKAKFEEVQSLASCLQKLDKQSKSMLANSRAQPQAFADGDSKQMLCLCQKVSDLSNFLLANAAPPPGQAQAPAPQDDWQSELAVLELDDDEILSRHHYAGEAAKAQNQALNRMKSLSLQLTNLTTSLPPGIFVRHGSSRLDVMKILIVGPKGTPYENGLFEFDLFCPSTFPNSPPNMNLRTTGGGTVRFNPNLYNCGKVCLSLLGTWAGEKWEPGKSTILQVLVSIQAMIFCDEPWYNEPGRGNPGRYNAQSLKHNQELQGHTVRYAMLNWLQPQQDSVWGDIVQKHFATNALVIDRAVSGWAINQSLKTQLKSALQHSGESWSGSGRRI